VPEPVQIQVALLVDKKSSAPEVSKNVGAQSSEPEVENETCKFSKSVATTPEGLANTSTLPVPPHGLPSSRIFAAFCCKLKDGDTLPPQLKKDETEKIKTTKKIELRYFIPLIFIL
jgi:hypothetical protein